AGNGPDRRGRLTTLVQRGSGEGLQLVRTDTTRFSLFSSKCLKSHSDKARKGGIMPKEFTLTEVAQITGIPYYRIYYAHYTGRLPEPKRVGQNRVYTQKDIRKIQEHFDRKETR